VSSANAKNDRKEKINWRMRRMSWKMAMKRFEMIVTRPVSAEWYEEVEEGEDRRRVGRALGLDIDLDLRGMFAYLAG
jgi:hypothetical protein